MENLGTHGHWYLVNQALTDGHHLPHQKDEIKSSQIKLIIKMFTLGCVAEI
jgi:hypothetical protein